MEPGAVEQYGEWRALYTLFSLDSSQGVARVPGPPAPARPPPLPHPQGGGAGWGDASRARDLSLSGARAAGRAGPRTAVRRPTPSRPALWSDLTEIVVRAPPAL